MIIDHRIWQAALACIDEVREDKLKRLLSGNCPHSEYSQICGFLDGLTFFEQSLKEANRPKTQKDYTNGFDEDVT